MQIHLPPTFLNKFTTETWLEIQQWEFGTNFNHNSSFYYPLEPKGSLFCSSKASVHFLEMQSNLNVFSQYMYFTAFSDHIDFCCLNLGC